MSVEIKNWVVVARTISDNSEAEDRWSVDIVADGEWLWNLSIYTVGYLEFRPNYENKDDDNYEVIVLGKLTDFEKTAIAGYNHTSGKISEGFMKLYNEVCLKRFSQEEDECKDSIGDPLAYTNFKDLLEVCKNTEASCTYTYIPDRKCVCFTLVGHNKNGDFSCGTCHISEKDFVNIDLKKLFEDILNKKYE